jgi:hypothetical protein
MRAILLLYFVFLLTHGTFVVVASDLITYTVLTINLLKPGTTMAVLVDGTYFPLEQHNEVAMMYTGLAPKSENSYKYTITKKSDQSVVSTEEFDRPAEYPSVERTYNDIYGQNWRKIDDMNTLPQLYAFDKDKYSPKGGMNDPAASNLYEEGTIATIHFKAPPEDIEKMHTYKMSRLVKLHGDLTYIK